MCRYATVTYKPHLACFRCRKSFKRRLKADVDPHGSAHEARCPQCAGPMANLGLDFRPPPQVDLEAWRVVQTLWQVGIGFSSCGCGPGPRPTTQVELRQFLTEWRADGEALLAARVRERPSEARTLAIVRLRKRVEQVTAVLALNGQR